MQSIDDILLLGSCTSLQLCYLVDKSRFKSDLHPLLFVEGLAGFLSLDQTLNLLQYLLIFFSAGYLYLSLMASLLS